MQMLMILQVQHSRLKPCPHLAPPPFTASAKFFLTYLILRTLMTVPLRFLLPQPGVWQAWIRYGILTGSTFNDALCWLALRAAC